MFFGSIPINGKYALPGIPLPAGEMAGAGKDSFPAALVVSLWYRHPGIPFACIV